MIVFAMPKPGKLFFPVMPLSGFELTRTAALERFARQRLLVVGDIILDRYLWGEVDRISPEAPVPVVLQSRTSDIAGGALNVARNLVAAGARTAIVGVVGDDDEARHIRELMTALRIPLRGLVVDPSRPTTLKTRVMTRGQQLLRLDRESLGPYPDAIERRLVDALRAQLKGCSAVIVSDYGKGVVSQSLVRHVVSLAHAANLPVVVDPKQHDFRHYAGADFLTPNLREASAAAGQPLDGAEAVVTQGRRLLRQFGGRGLVITRSHEGVSLITRGQPVHIPARAREVFDVTGAGDTFISHFALALSAGIAPPEAAMIGNAAAGVAVTKLGAVTVAPEELAAALGSTQSLSKVRTADDLALTLDHLRDQRRRIVFTNGCFDLFHAGHVRMLHEARALGDVLIVALNTDASVRRIKGRPRPILPEDERAAVVSSLAVVDYVLFFEEDSPERLIQRLRPDVLVKGSQEGDPVGADIVRAYGGQVVEMPIYQTLSTGELVESHSPLPEGAPETLARKIPIMDDFFLPAAAVALAFLSGSLPTALLMGRMKGIDIRRHGSGNVGATNAMRVLGKPWGIACLLIDALKGWLPAVLFAGRLVSRVDWSPAGLAHPNWTLVLGIAAVLGHMFSPWIGWKGGKGVATSLGAFLAVAPKPVLICLALGILIIGVTGYVSLASITGAGLLAILIFFFSPPDNRPWVVIAVAAALGAFVIWKHRENIQRLIEGRESRIFRKNP
jgi:D-beta-D-heptose 7-phosphate kinase / D-beta-D-heptose 1-phosphate adenosyltransferase